MKKYMIKTTCAVAGIIALVVSQYSDQIRTSEKGLALIGNAEGCQRTPYVCPAGLLTYGIGTAESSGEKIQPNKIYSEQEIAASWVRNIQIAERCVNQYANGRKLPQGAFDAATSITFNVGCATMKKSTLFKYAQTGDIKAMCGQFPRWIYSNGKKLRGLETRRQQEKALCLTF